MRKLNKLLILIICCVMLSPLSVYATEPTEAKEKETETKKETETEKETEKETETETDDYIPEVNSKIMLCDNWQIPTVTYGQTVNIVLPLVNMDKYDVTEVIIAPEISTETSSFPFEIEKTGYAVQLTELLGSNYNEDPLERRQEVTYTFKARDDITTGYYSLNFDVAFKNVNGTQETATITTYIKTIGKKGAGSDSKSVPRVIVTGFKTVPENVHAGEDFTLTLYVKNTSSDTDVSNIKCDLEAATDGTDEDAVTQAFLPKQGSSTVFMENISKSETKEISIEMNAKASLTQKPYVLNVKMEYEDESSNQFTSEADVSIPVLQEAKFDISSPEVMPASIDVGSESNIMFSIYNTGKTIMYNVSVKFEADSITGGDTYVGKIQTGETGNVDAMVTGQAATTDDGTVKVLITYEDEAGNPATVEKSLNLNVSEADFSMEEDIGIDMEEEEMKDSSISPIGIIIAVILIIGAIVGAVFFIKFRNKKKAEMLENDLLADIDEDNEYENQYDDIDSVLEQGEEETNSIEQEIEKDEEVTEKAKETIEKDKEVTESDKKKDPQEEGDDDEIS
jgi:archaellum component FlaG (FlaF/FlaG flagellin family)/flagellar basal body-associated protein FliL